jgi:cobyric acid synthase CobQ/L-threonine-O-3-phosphate decarboxylase
MLETRMRFTHGGNLRALAERAGCAPEDILDFSASINPLGPPEWLREELSRAVSGLAHYPDPDCVELVRSACARFGVDAAEVVCGNGSTEALFALLRALGPERALIPVPAYTDYARASLAAGVEVAEFAMDESSGFAWDFEALSRAVKPGDAVFLGRPNNPTGAGFSRRAFLDLAAAHPRATFIVDEAFIDFTARRSIAPERPDNAVVLYSLTKMFSVPGLRVGLGFAEPGAAARIRGEIPPWSVSSLAQAAGARALTDAGFVQASRRRLRGAAAKLARDLRALGAEVLPSEANFMLFRFEGRDAAGLADELLLRRRIAVRACGDFGGLGPEWLRVAVRTGEENAGLVEALAEALGAPEPRVRKKRRTPAIMVQGAGSNAGKSVIAAALCRILLQDGLSPAPFKSQNMSLNSFVTRDGREMGRAQAVQAAACRLAPDSRMNPVLLKPGSDTGSQVIVMGRPVGRMNVAEYLAYKPEAWKAAAAAYDELAAEYGVMVLEGAGSPAEINLKSHDIVNMRMAGYAGARVLLAADIDRGGVFAQFAGTMELLSERERGMVGGYVINRFRGDETLLAPALAAIARRTGTPFLGVLPYVEDLGLPEEDSVSFKDGFPDGSGEGAAIDVALIDLPRISNFTDMDALRAEPDVRVRVVRRAADLDPADPPDALVIPGSRSVAHDLDRLRQEGLDERIAALAGKSEIVGLCGGYQMLGTRILDPGGLESDRGSVPGLGLLPIESELAAGKTLAQAEAAHVPTGEAVRGYEIHHGVTRAHAGAVPVLTSPDGRVIGHANEDGLVWGTYLHGVFDAGGFRRAFVNRLRRRKGLVEIAEPAAFDLDAALDRLAALVRERLDMERIYGLIGI